VLCKDLQIKFLSFGLHIILATVLQNSYQDNWDKTSKLLGQILELVGHFVPVVKQLKYALQRT